MRIISFTLEKRPILKPTLIGKKAIKYQATTNPTKLNPDQGWPDSKPHYQQNIKGYKSVRSISKKATA